jgi:hypothetical protein
MSENMKQKVVQENLLPKFQATFDTLWNDPEFSFKGDNKLISMICASLRYEAFQSKCSSIMDYGVITTSIILI